MGLPVDDQLVGLEVRVATVVDVAGLVAVEGSVDDVVRIQAEQIHVQAKAVVDLFAFVSDWNPDFFTDVLDNDVLRLEPNK